MEHPIQDLLAQAMQKMRELVDSQTIIGQAIEVSEGIKVIPISKVTFGFVSGGTDFATQKQKDLFGGAASSGATVSPVGFLVVQNNEVRLIQLAEGGQTVDRVLNMVPDVVTKVEGIITKAADKKKTSQEEI